jgi:hypothetical protein
MDYGRVEQIVREAAEAASVTLAERGQPPLPHPTLHTLRRTYISIAPVAYEWDVKYVMDQVDHADPKMTLDVYAQMQQRAKRGNGAKFDKLIRDARGGCPVRRGSSWWRPGCAHYERSGSFNHRPSVLHVRLIMRGQSSMLLA